MQEQDYYLGFSVFPGVGAKRFQLLLSSFGSAKAAWTSERPRLSEVLKEKLTEDFLRFREKFDIESYKAALKRKHVSYITFDDTDYPQKLKDLEGPPFVLYLKGDLSCLSLSEAEIESHSTPLRYSQEKNSSRPRLHNTYIGIVGTRKVTSYGRQITEQFTKEMVDDGCLVISGLALGVDAIAHQTTIDTGGKTIAVLGCGVDCCYPKENSRLYEQILSSGGLILSEYPIGAAPNKGSFPSRNRIIAALSDGLLVTEGAEDSGSLITAEYALDLRRSVFAIPGPVTSSLSRGPLRLIRKGAKLVTSGEEIFEELGIGHCAKGNERNEKIKGDTKEEQEIIDLLLHEGLTFDEIVKKTGKTSTHVAIVLSTLELKGIKKDQSGVYSLV